MVGLAPELMSGVAGANPVGRWYRGEAETSTGIGQIPGRL